MVLNMSFKEIYEIHMFCGRSLRADKRKSTFVNAIGRRNNQLDRDQVIANCKHGLMLQSIE